MPSSENLQHQPSFNRRRSLRSSSLIYEPTSTLTSSATVFSSTLASSHHPSSSSLINPRRSSSSQKSSTMRTSVASHRHASVESDQSTEGIRLTKTGRLSKAKKGQPVHKCEQCDKVYTRAEHLRRHMLNHSNQTLRCEFEGCTKSFHRADLLSRHMDEHKAGNLATRSASSPGKSASSTRVQRASAGSISELKKGSIKDHGALGITNLNYANPYPSPVPSTTNSPPSGPYWPTIYTSTPAVDNSHPSFVINEPCEAYPPFTSPPSFPTPNFYESEDWLSKPIMTGNRSPMSIASSNPSPYWTQVETMSRQPRMFSPSNSDYSGYQTSEPASEPPFGHLLLDPAIDQSLIEDMSFNQDLFDHDMILRELNTIPSLQSNLEPYIQQFLESYWVHFHPIYPVIHKPTFETQGGSPLVKGLMMAIGAQFLRTDVSQTAARVLRDTCLKRVREFSGRTYHQMRLWDLAAVFLAEALSLFKARRPSPQLSTQFENLLSGLMYDRHDVFSAEPTAELDTLEITDTDKVNQSHMRWLRVETKRRLFLCGYILELQQSKFFGSQRQISEKDLPLPCSESLWKAEPLDAWLDLAKAEPLDPHYFFDCLCQVQRRKSTDFDIFRSSIVGAYFSHNRDTASHPHVADFVGVIAQHPQVLFSYHASMMTMYTPVHTLLAVSGESFVMGQKLATRDQFLEAGTLLATWVASEDAALAQRHAAHLISLGVQHGRLNVLPEEWVLCVAALTFWARNVWPSQQLMPASLPTVEPVTESQVRLYAHALAGGSATMVTPWEMARAIMNWVHGRMAFTLGGLVEDNGRVLKKLIDGRRVEI